MRIARWPLFRFGSETNSSQVVYRLPTYFLPLDRLKLACLFFYRWKAFLWLTILWELLVYYPLCHWVSASNVVQMTIPLLCFPANRLRAFSLQWIDLSLLTLNLFCSCCCSGLGRWLAAVHGRARFCWRHYHSHLVRSIAMSSAI